MARVLLVDDSEGIRVTVGAILRDEGHAVHAVPDATEALSAFAADRPDVVLIDVALGGMGGVELAKRLRTHDAHLPVIIITGASTVEAVRDALRIGAFDLLIKPITRTDLARAVSLAVEHRAVAAERDEIARGNSHYQAQLEKLVDERADELRRANSRLVATVEGVARALATLVEEREESAEGNHQIRVAGLARALAKEMRLPMERIMGVYLSAMMHDIGILRIPLGVLRKRDPLTAAEIDMLRQHPQTAHDLLKPIPFEWPVAEIVLQHHERHDGSGYPQGLRGADILPEAAIVGLADEVDAMVSARPYRSPLSPPAVLAELARQRGKAFAPEVIDAFTKLVTSGRYQLDD